MGNLGFDSSRTVKNINGEPSNLTRQTVEEYPKILRSILLAGHDYLYQGLVPRLQIMPANIYRLSHCCNMQLTPHLTPGANVRSNANGYEMRFTTGLVFAALEMAFFISGMGHEHSEIRTPRKVKELISRLSDCSTWTDVKGPSRFAYLDDPPLWKCLQEASPLCPRDENELKEVFSILFPTILFAIAAHERSHILWGHLRMKAESGLHDDLEVQMTISRALELQADIIGAAFQCSYLHTKGASERQMKIAGYCLLGSFLIMHCAQQTHGLGDYHPTVKVRYLSTRNVLAATDEVFHPLPWSATHALIDGFTEFADHLEEYLGTTFKVLEGAFEEGARIWAEFEVRRTTYARNPEEVLPIEWKSFFYSSHDQEAHDALYLLESLLEIQETKLRFYARDIFNPDTWGQDACISWIGDEHELG